MKTETRRKGVGERAEAQGTWKQGETNRDRERPETRRGVYTCTVGLWGDREVESSSWGNKSRERHQESQRHPETKR